MAFPATRHSFTDDHIFIGVGVAIGIGIGFCGGCFNPHSSVFFKDSIPIPTPTPIFFIQFVIDFYGLLISKFTYSNNHFGIMPPAMLPISNR